MFSKASGKGRPAAGATGTTAPAGRTAGGNGVPSIISPDTTLTGNLESQGDVQVDGRVHGDVMAHTLTIGEQGSVRGTVKAEQLKVCGEVVGEIQGGTISLTASAKVDGDIVHDSLSIEPGAHLDGHCRRRSPEASDGTAARQPSGDRTPRKSADTTTDTATDPTDAAHGDSAGRTSKGNGSAASAT
jgi:cytoskeletal protein CcmA (bactofilin family)